MNQKLWYKEESKHWCEALPLGNGRIAAMVYSGVYREMLSLNEDTLWSGVPRDHAEKDRYPFYETARDLAMKGEYSKAQDHIEENITGAFTEAYMPLGDLYIDMEHTGDFENYTRELDLKTAVAKCSYDINTVHYNREIFISNQQQVLSVNLTATASFSFSLYMDSQLKYSLIQNGNDLELEGLCPSHSVPSYIHEVVGGDGIIYKEDDIYETGIRFRAISHIDTDGTIICENNKIYVKDATFAKVLFAVRSNFAGFDKFPEVEKKEYISVAREDIKKASLVSYSTLKEEHIKDYESLYLNYSFIPQCTSFEELDTFARILKYNEDKLDDGLVVLLLNFGRYLMISSSREGTRATNLQGIWNNLLRAPWSSNYTININTEMNYWATFGCSLNKLHQPLVDLIKNIAVVGGRVAKEYYNAGGFVSHHNSDIWAHANPVGMRRKKCATHDFWPMSAAWLVRHLFEEYEYTKDINFLRDTAYPLMKKSAEFFLDVLVTDENGNRVFAPSTSPENNFYIGDDIVAVSKTTTMTVSIIVDLFENLLKACDILGTGADFAETLKTQLALFPDIGISSDDRILEWSEELPEWDMLHRHVSHLYPLYPATQITPELTPKLADAARKSLECRTDAGTGWSRAWKICLWARLNDGEHAYNLMRGQLNLASTGLGAEEKFTGDGAGSYPNLFGAHPPFQIDGNFGVLAGMLEMLAQYKHGVLYIFKALPDAWKTGEVSGLAVKDGLTLNMKWEDKKLTSLTINAIYATNVKIETLDETLELKLEKGINKIK